MIIHCKIKGNNSYRPQQKSMTEPMSHSGGNGMDKATLCSLCRAPEGLLKPFFSPKPGWSGYRTDFIKSIQVKDFPDERYLQERLDIPDASPTKEDWPWRPPFRALQTSNVITARWYKPGSSRTIDSTSFRELMSLIIRARIFPVGRLSKN